MSRERPERRRHLRAAAAHKARIVNARGEELAHGRTANVSETGAMIIVDGRSGLDLAEELIAELHVPADGGRRVVRYRCRIARTQRLGQLLGLGLEFVEKLG